MPCDGHTIVCGKSLVHQFPHEERNTRNDSLVPNDITTKVLWERVLKWSQEELNEKLASNVKVHMV